MSEIDVSKCYYYNDDNSPFCCELYDDECEAQNCYFQQLQQLKAENEELKKSIEILKDTVKIQARTIDKTQSDWFNNFSEMKNKYEQKLEKIKEICAEQKERIEFNDDIDYESFDYILKIIEREN